MPIHKRTAADLEKRNLKIQAMKDKLSKQQEEKEALQQLEIDQKKIHKPGMKHDSKTFETNYKEQVEKWSRLRKQSQDHVAASPTCAMAETSSVIQ